MVLRTHIRLLVSRRLSQVDEEAYGALEECIFSGDFNVCETVPAGGASGYLVNPLGGLVVTMSGAAR